MRRHEIHSQIDSKILTKYICNTVNVFSVSYIKKRLDESGLTKEERLKLIDEIIRYMRTDNTER